MAGVALFSFRADRIVFAARNLLVAVLVAAFIAGWTASVVACPFCSSLPRTISDDLIEATVGVVARCESLASASDGFRTYRMRITDVVKGDPALKNSVVEVSSFQELSGDKVVWLLAYGEDQLQWALPKDISAASVDYLRGLRGLPESGTQRLAYFLRYLSHDDDVVAADAYNEFAEASLQDVVGLRDRLDRQWVIGQIRDASVPVHRRRLCWTFLSQCGTAADAELLDQSIQTRQVDPAFDPGMDAAIACYITLVGPSALARIERDYLANPDAESSDCFAAVSAIRVHGTALKLIPRARLAKALRQLLQRPELADLVISDLARWEDWTAIDRMVELFALPNEKTGLLKPAVVRYLKACPLPAAAAALDQVRAIDPKAVQLAESSMMLYSGLASLPVPPPDDEPSSGPAKPAPPAVAERESETGISVE